MYKKYFKIFADTIMAIVLLVLLMPFMLTIAALIIIKMGRPVLFIQERPGLNEKIFKLLKFRTMSQNNDLAISPLPTAKRITGLGKFLRETSIDELPELFNIIKGDMSFVGPRPLLVRYLPYYSNEERRRHSVRPGLTGLAQINGRNALSWEDKFKFDILYVDSISFKLDIKIIISTLIKVIKRDGINSRAFEIVMPYDEYLKLKGANRIPNS